RGNVQKPGVRRKDTVLQSVLFLIYFLVKLFAVGFVIFALRTALARVRIEQATRMFWTILTPLSLLQMGLVILLR
ncbi:MAG: NADH-quinone oxidoreductase subunit H, partial [Thaumarchaeota archaeon]|nr:NADH-quinone oxidoreductase subunit H [Nitrososphaerota archaeon]